jgi:hypothetical protein
VDDYASINNNSNLVFGNGSFSVSIWIRTPITSSGEGTPSAWGPIVSKGCSTSAPAGTWWLAQNSTNTNRITFNISSTAGGTFVCALTTNTLSDGWHNIVATRSGSTSFLYQDSRLVATDTTSDSNLTSTSPLFIGTNTTSSPKYTNMALSQVSIYNKTLTAADVSQNYYGGPIVTGSLAFALDAGNLVSYPKSGTTVYTLTGSVNGTLTNGPTFNPTFGGCWNFDGTDDYILLGSSITPGNGNWTLSAWVRGFGGVVGNTSGGPVASGFGIFSTGGNYKIFYANYDGSWNYNYGNTTLNPNEWYFLTWVNYTGNTMKMYVNGVADSSVFNSLTSNGGPVDAVGGTQGTPGGTFNGNIASVQWNIGKAFTDDEVLQNYNATK